MTDVFNKKETQKDTLREGDMKIEAEITVGLTQTKEPRSHQKLEETKILS